MSRWLLVGALGCAPGPAAAPEPPGPAITLPPGFTIGRFAEVPGARSLCRASDGTVFVGTRDEGRVHAVRDRDGDGVAESHWTVARGLQSPNGVAFHQGDLYVAEISRVLRYPGILEDLDDPPDPVLVSDAFPGDRAHGWKFIAFGPDGRLYVPVGAPCNACVPPGPLHATITRMRPDGSGLEVFAEGIRNTVGFDWRPDTSVLWFTDNGRDRWSPDPQLTDRLPPDELNRAPEPGLHFGFPWCHGTDLPDPDLGARDCGPYRDPVLELGPHVAALGMRFYTGDSFPAAFRGDIFIAEHGSWNRTVPIGYRVVRVEVGTDGTAAGPVPFAEGWLRPDGTHWGRPVDVLVAADGALLVSDDHGGVIWRIAWGE